MTRYSSFSILFLAIFLMSSQASLAGTHTHTNTAAATVSDSREMNTPAANPLTPVESTPALPPVTQSQHPVEKGHTPALNELAHIHHFHKERVKKIKRHHGKFWLLSQLLLIVCHVALLVIAYLHITH